MISIMTIFLAMPTAFGFTIGGSLDAASKHPHSVAFFKGKELDDFRDRKPFCSGSLISKKKVVTAAHCFLDSIPILEWEERSVVIELSDDDFRREGKSKEITDVERARAINEMKEKAKRKYPGAKVGFFATSFRAGDKAKKRPDSIVVHFHIMKTEKLAPIRASAVNVRKKSYGIKNVFYPTDVPTVHNDKLWHKSEFDIAVVELDRRVRIKNKDIPSFLNKSACESRGSLLTKQIGAFRVHGRSHFLPPGPHIKDQVLKVVFDDFQETGALIRDVILTMEKLKIIKRRPFGHIPVYPPEAQDTIFHNLEYLPGAKKPKGKPRTIEYIAKFPQGAKYSLDVQGPLSWSIWGKSVSANYDAEQAQDGIAHYLSYLRKLMEAIKVAKALKVNRGAIGKKKWALGTKMLEYDLNDVRERIDLLAQEFNADGENVGNVEVNPTFPDLKIGKFATGAEAEVVSGGERVVTGDSGAPLVYVSNTSKKDLIQVGVTSSASNIGRNGKVIELFVDPCKPEIAAFLRGHGAKFVDLGTDDEGDLSGQSEI